MSYAAYPLDAVIRRVPAAQRKNALPAHQVLAAVHPTKAQVLVNEQPWPWEADAYQYYVATPDASAVLPQQPLVLTDFTGRKRAVEYLLGIQSVERSRIGDLARGLAGKPLPADALTELVSRWLQEYIDSHTSGKTSPLADFSPAVRERAGAHAASLASSRLGLLLVCTIDLPEEAILLELNVPLQVLTRDCEETLDARVEVDLAKPLPGPEMGQVREHARPQEETEEQVRALAVRWFREQCTLENFCYREAAVRAALQTRLEAYLKGELKREIIRLRVTCTPKFPIMFPHEICHPVTCELHRGATKIKVDHRLRLERLNIADYRRHRIGELKPYVEDCLERATHGVFFGKQYVDVIVEFPQLGAEIEKRVKAELQVIGFKAEPLITLPDDPFVKRYLEGQFSFNTGEPDPSPAEGAERADPRIFATKDPRVTFGLSIAGRARLLTYDKVRQLELITPGHDLSVDFKRVAREAAAEVLATLSPQQLYMEFHGPMAAAEMPGAFDGAPDNPGRRTPRTASPEQRVRKAVEERLAAEFGAKIESVSIRLEVTELSMIVDALQPEQDHRFELKVTTAGAGVGTTFQIACRIDAIDPEGWLKLQKLCGSGAGQDVAARAAAIGAAVIQRLKDTATRELHVVDRRLLGLPLREARDYAERTVFHEALGGIRVDFGLMLKITVFDHDGMIPEADPDMAYLEERLKKLRAAAVELPYNHPDVKPMETEMEGIKTRLAALKPAISTQFARISERLELVANAKLDRLLPPAPETNPAKATED